MAGVKIFFQTVGALFGTGDFLQLPPMDLHHGEGADKSLIVHQN